MKDSTFRSPAAVNIGPRWVGDDHPVWVIGEIGINHNGSVELAKRLIEGAARAGCTTVKFQKRTPELCVPADQRDQMRETPWGRMTYLEYRERVELDATAYGEIDALCRSLGVLWFASCWDTGAVDFMEAFDPPCYKLASASLTDSELLEKVAGTGRPVILSTGMSTMDEIEDAVDILGTEDLLIAHATSAYPCPVEALNLRVLHTLRARYPQCPIGYSGHETGLAPTWAAVALGATFVERHITLDRAMWGSDQSASVEIGGLERLVANIQDIELALGDGKKRVYECELPSMRRLRKPRLVLDRAG